jgi:hypothetical protein
MNTNAFSESIADSGVIFLGTTKFFVPVSYLVILTRTPEKKSKISF